MTRPVTLFTGQWTDLSLRQLAPAAAELGYDGLELACQGDHGDALRLDAEPGYGEQLLAFLHSYGLGCWALSGHLLGQAVGDEITGAHKATLPGPVWGSGEPEGVRARAAEALVGLARAAKGLDIRVVTGFTGSPIWPRFYPMPPWSQEEIASGYRRFAQRWKPVLDRFGELGVTFALELHPGQIAYDGVTAQMALEALDGHPALGFNLDPSHLPWQGVDPAQLARHFGRRIVHVHMKDVATSGDGWASLLGSHLPFGDARRGWDFRSVGRGQIDFDALFRELNRAGYRGPLSVEWEDPDMDRWAGAAEALEATHRLGLALPE